MINDHVVCPTCQTVAFLSAEERDLAYIRCGACLSNIPVRRSGGGGLVAFAACGAVLLCGALLAIVIFASAMRRRLPNRL